MSPRSYFPPDAPPHVVRPMTLGDLAAVRRIDRDAFDRLRRQQRPTVRYARLRSMENMDAAIRRAHPGVVIEWPPGTVVGYCFTHVWGSLGWLGTLGVAPPHQGFGLGQAVIAAGLDVLREAGCRILALETMPDSGKNLALYTRLGLEPRQLTLLCQGAPRHASATSFDIWRDDDDVLGEVAARLVSGLDPTPAARWLVQEGAGETLVWRETGKPIAFAVLRTAARRLDGVQVYVTVEAAACLPEWVHVWPQVLSEMQTYARSLGKSGLVLPVYTRQVGLLRGLLDMGLQIVHTRVRLVTGESLGCPDAILFLTLAM